MMEKKTLQYKDEEDRSYGLSGMAVAMYAWDGEEYMVGMDIDSAPGDGMQLSVAFNYSGNPRMSVKHSWAQMVKNFELSTAMLLGNAMCRSYCRGGRVSSSSMSLIRALVRDEGKEICSLEEDEINAIYDRVYTYLDRMFSHSRVVETAHTLAGVLVRQRKLSAAEALDILRAIN